MIASTEGGYPYEAVGLRERDYWSIAIDGVTVGGEVPLSAFVLDRLVFGGWRELGRRRELGKRQR